VKNLYILIIKYDIIAENKSKLWLYMNKCEGHQSDKNNTPKSLVSEINSGYKEKH